MSKIQSIALAVVSGLLLGFSWSAMGGLTPLIFFGFVPLLFLEHQISSGKSKGGILWLGYITFFFFNLIVGWWLYCVDESMTTKLISVGTPVLINPLFMATIFKWFSNTKKRLGSSRGYLAFILFWLAFEYLHFNWGLSYPWLTLGNVFANRPEFIQWYEYTGAMGGSLWILLVNLFIFLGIKHWFTNNTFPKKQIILVSLLVVLPVSLSLFRYTTYTEEIDPVNITVVQPNIDPYNVKFSGSVSEQIELFLSLAEKNMDSNTDYVLGPETALPYTIWIDKLNENPMRQRIKEFSSTYPNSNVVLGASLAQVYFDESEISATSRSFDIGDKWYDSYNSAIQIDQTDTVQYYHKSKLVLGVESMPFSQIFRHFQELVFDLGGTTGSLGTQDERGVFQSSTSNHKIAPVICWESIYGEFMTDYIKNGANLIFVLTNDGWWEETAGHIQHLHYSRLRAIESRRSVARSANTGISCFINQRGDVIQPTQWWVPTAINGTINANDKITFYVAYGDYIGRLAAAMSILMLIWVLVKKFGPQKVD